MTTVAEVFRRHGPAYRARFGATMPRRHVKAMQAIETCRTAARGGRVFSCPRCQERHFSYRSCRNRHCPRCQSENGLAWLGRQRALLLPGEYFLVTFTVPEQLRLLIRAHQRELLNVLFRSSWAAMAELASETRFVGGLIGALGVLHTWTRDLLYHPHVHYLVAGGALKGESWVTPRRRGFLVPVRALSVIYRARFRDAVRKLALNSEVPGGVWTKPWVVHCKPVGSGEKALGYLARYVFRVAIGNDRIVSDEGGRVTFRYRDGETGLERRRTVTAEEFLRRFLQHVVPRGFVKVRYYGLFSRRGRERLEKLRQELGAREEPRGGGEQEPGRFRRVAEVCPKCQGRMDLVGVFHGRPP